MVYLSLCAFALTSVVPEFQGNCHNGYFVQIARSFLELSCSVNQNLKTESHLLNFDAYESGKKTKYTEKYLC